MSAVENVFLKKGQTRSTIEHTCNRLNMEKRRLQEDINRLDREMESIRC